MSTVGYTTDNNNIFWWADNIRGKFLYEINERASLIIYVEIGLNRKVEEEEDLVQKS